MIYMVEMDLKDKSLLPQFHEWYRGHVRFLLSIPGIISAQRFESIATTASPFLAIYGLANPHVLSSEAYTAKAGPDSTKEWKARLTNWHRNLLDGADAPVVPRDGWLTLVDRLTDQAPRLPGSCTAHKPAGLDRSMIERGILVGSVAVPPPVPQENPDMMVRVFRPISDLTRQPPA